jgi:hypothetical protein
MKNLYERLAVSSEGAFFNSYDFKINKNDYNVNNIQTFSLCAELEFYEFTLNSNNCFTHDNDIQILMSDRFLHSNKKYFKRRIKIDSMAKQ